MDHNTLFDLSDQVRKAAEALDALAVSLATQGMRMRLDAQQPRKARTSAGSITRQQQSTMFGLWAVADALTGGTATAVVGANRRHAFTAAVLGLPDEARCSWRELSEAEADVVIGALTNVAHFARAVAK